MGDPEHPVLQPTRWLQGSLRTVHLLAAKLWVSDKGYRSFGRVGLVRRGGIPVAPPRIALGVCSSICFGCKSVLCVRPLDHAAATREKWTVLDDYPRPSEGRSERGDTPTPVQALSIVPHLP